MAADLTDDLLKRIVGGSGRVYTHEAKAMAAEIIRRRQAEKAVPPVPPPQPWWGTGKPQPIGQPHFP